MSTPPMTLEEMMGAVVPRGTPVPAPPQARPAPLTMQQLVQKVAERPSLQQMMTGGGPAAPAPPGSPAPPAALDRNVPPQQNLLDPLGQNAPAPPSPLAPTNNELMQSPPPAALKRPGATPETTADPPSDFNLYINQMIKWAQAGGAPWSGIDPMKREHQADVLRAQEQREETQLDEAQKRWADTVREHNEQELENLKPFFEVQDRKVRQAQRLVDQAQSELPTYRPVPALDPGDMQMFLFGTLSVALISALAGKAGFMRTTQYFTGAVQGLIEGDEKRAEMYHKAWQDEFNSAMEKYRASQDNMKNILYATDVPINQILRQAEIQAKVDGAEEKYLLARQGHIDKLRSQIQSEERLSDNLTMTSARVKGQLDGAIARILSGKGAAAIGNNLDKYGRWAVAKITAGGNLQLLNSITSRWASPQRAELWNTISKEWFDQGVDPTVFTENQIGIQVEKAAQRWSKLRYEAMGRLEDSLAMLYDPMKQAIIEANGLHPRAYNRPVNDLIKEFGAGPQTARIAYANALAYTVGREYVSLATMPVSNAQMHWGSQEIAKKMVDGSMSLAELEGFYKATIKEVQTNRIALKSAVEASMRDVESMGSTVHSEDYGLPKENRPQTEDEANAKYLNPPVTNTTTR